MQIIAIAMVLLFCVAVLVLSSLVGLVFGAITATAVRDKSWPRRLAISAKSALPFACLALIAIPFILRWVIAERTSVPGSCRFPNGYSLMLIDRADAAWVYNTSNESTRDSIHWQKDGVDGVRTLQLAGRYILGGRDSHGFAHTTKSGDEVDSYFVLDTETGELTTTPSLKQFQSAASQLGIHLKLEPAYTVYSRYGLMGLAGVSPLIKLLLSLALVLLLARWMVQLRTFLRNGSNRTALPSY